MNSPERLDRSAMLPFLCMLHENHCETHHRCLANEVHFVLQQRREDSDRLRRCGPGGAGARNADRPACAVPNVRVVALREGAAL